MDTLSVALLPLILAFIMFALGLSMQIADIKYILTTTGNLKTGDVFVNTGSVPVMEQGPTNFMKVSVA